MDIGKLRVGDVLIAVRNTVLRSMPGPTQRDPQKIHKGEQACVYKIVITDWALEVWVTTDIDSEIRILQPADWDKYEV